MAGTVDDVQAELAALERRVAWIERHAGVAPLDHTGVDQETRDRELLSRHPQSYQEAVAQEAARKRQDQRDRGESVDDVPEDSAPEGVTIQPPDGTAPAGTPQDPAPKTATPSRRKG